MAATFEEPKKITLNNTRLYEDKRLAKQENILSKRVEAYKARFKFID